MDPNYDQKKRNYTSSEKVLPPSQNCNDNEDTNYVSKLKHPTASPKFDNLLLNGPVKNVHEIVLDDINEELIQKAAIRTKGAAGPSKFDADDW